MNWLTQNLQTIKATGISLVKKLLEFLPEIYIFSSFDHLVNRFVNTLIGCFTPESICLKCAKFSIQIELGGLPNSYYVCWLNRSRTIQAPDQNDIG